MIPRIVLAGASSGTGKTTAVVALTKALRNRGLTVQTFKCGPDYLDPTYHTRASGRQSHNLDGWMMGKEAVLSTFERGSRGADIAIIEGVMGLFDGASPTSDEGSTAEIAKWLEAPVVILLDASGMARTIAAVAHGFATFDPDLTPVGMIVNRIGSASHLDILKKSRPVLKILGGFLKNAALSFPERHLGLRTANRQACDQAVPEALFDSWAALAEESLDIDALLEVARNAPHAGTDASNAGTNASNAGTDASNTGTDASNAGTGCNFADEDLQSGNLSQGRMTAMTQGPLASTKIGIAFDEAFHFYYDDNLARLESLGAELIRFSPQRDGRLPDVDGLYFGGGYPETCADELSRNTGMREAIVAFADRGGPIYAECGGFMYLTSGIRTTAGDYYPMTGIFPGTCQMFDRLRALGYVEVETQEASLLGAAGVRFRGHEFRYSDLIDCPADLAKVYRVRKRRTGNVTPEGYGAKNVLGSYVHAHWASNPLVAEGFVQACRAWRASAGGGILPQ